MKKIVFSILAIITVFSLTACKQEDNTIENDSQVVEENLYKNLPSNDQKLIQDVYGSAETIQLLYSDKTESVENLLVDIDGDRINELIKPTYEYMENHLHVYKIIESVPTELESSEYVSTITSIYETNDGVYVIGHDADGMCYTNVSLYKIGIDRNKVVLTEVLNATCDQEVEEQKINELQKRLDSGAITQEEWEREYESAAFHTLKYKVNGNYTSEDDFNAMISELNNKAIIRKIAYINDSIENLWSNK